MSNPYDVLSSQTPNGELVYPSDSLLPPPVKSSFAQRMIAKRGHVEGQGLGANGLGNGTLTADEYLEYRNTPWKRPKQKTPPPVIKAGIPSKFVRIQRLDANMEPSAVVTMFDSQLREKVKEIYGLPRSDASEAFVEFESEEDAATAVMKYSHKSFGWNGQKAWLERIREQDIQQCSHDGPFDIKDHDRKCRLSVFLREQEEENAFQSNTVFISGLNESHELKHLVELLGSPRSERCYDMNMQVIEARELWTARPENRGTALVRFHEDSAVDAVQEWNGKYFKNKTIYLKCVPDSEYGEVSRVEAPKANPASKLHMNNLPPGADLGYIRQVLHKYEVGDQSFIMGGKTAVVYLKATDAKDVLARFSNGLRFQGRKHYFNEWTGGKKGKGARGTAPIQYTRPAQPPHNPEISLTEQVAGLNLGSNLGPQSSNWRSRTPSRNRAPQNANEVIVRKLAFAASEQDLRQLFNGFYTIVKIVQKKGFAFVTLRSQEQAQRAIRELDGYNVLGRKVVVEAVRPQK